LGINAITSNLKYYQEMDEEELTRRRDHIDELARRLKRGDISQEFYDEAFDEQYEIEKQFGLLKPGSWLWDEMLDDLIEHNKKNSKDSGE
jgi:hypothetical protein